MHDENRSGRMSNPGRRRFLATTLAVGAAAGLHSFAATTAGSRPRRAGSRSVMGMAAPPLDTVRVGLIGVGERGTGFVRHFCNIEGARVTAICDTDKVVLDRAAAIVSERGAPEPALFTGDDFAYRGMLGWDGVDIVVISTPWRWHATMAVEAMESGKHAFVEVPAVTTVEEAWQLVDTSERTRMHCMMLENVCYGRDELMVLNMVRQGLFGELLHGEAAYIHELRWQMKQIDRKTGSWRTPWQTRRNGNLYPTHGLGPIAQYMGINRGDRFDYMTSMSSPALGRAAYARREFPEDHPRNRLDYVTGDINTSLIKTVNGRTIMVQYDTTTPRPYSRHNLIQGTNGVFAGFPNRIALEHGGSETFHEWDYDMAKWYAKYDHPLWTGMGRRAVEQGGHGGMDYLMCWRLVDCLRNGQPLDQDVYDAAAWSVISPISADSVADRGNSKPIPDFTRGAWKTAEPLGIVGERA